MNARISASSTSSLLPRPERPFKYAEPAAASNGGTVTYNRPLESYFDVSMASRLLPAKPPAVLYDAIARAHDRQLQVSPDVVDPSWTIPRPLILNPTKRRCSLAQVTENSPEYMRISPDVPEWCPRRFSRDDRRVAVGVAPSEVNTLVPYIPPIDTSLPPPSKEWLDAKAKQILADAHAELGRLQSNPAHVTAQSGPSKADDDTESDSFEYDVENTLDERASVLRTPAPQPHQAHPEFNQHTYDSLDMDTDTDMDSDDSDGCNRGMAHISVSSPRTLSDVLRRVIPRKPPSVVIFDDKDILANAVASSSDDERPGKRPNNAKDEAYRGIAKTPKRHENDFPARQGSRGSGHESEEDTSSGPTSLFARATTPPRPPVSSFTAAALQMKQVRVTSPTRALPPTPKTALVPSKPAKVFPCHLNNCTHVCASAGDLQRHQQSLRHCPPSHTCLACGKSYTRSDALKRHLNSKAACKKVHATKIADGAEEPADTNIKAV